MNPRPFQGLRVLAVSPSPTHPTIAGNRARMRALLERLRDLGATVRLIHVGHEAGDRVAMEQHWTKDGFTSLPFAYPPPRFRRWNRYAALISRYSGLELKPRVDVDDWYDPSLGPAITAEVNAFKPHAVLMQYIWFSALLTTLPPSILRVLDAQDVFSHRNERMRDAGIDHEWFSVPPREEARGLNRFNVIMAIQEQEAAHYRSLTSQKVVTVGHFVPLLDAGLSSRSPNVLIIGSGNTINVDGVRWFVDAVWPSVLASVPEATLNIVGQVGASISPAPNVVISGPVQSLQSAYEDARIVVTPLRGGTGLKIKSAESLGAGRVVVSTPIAAEGLEAAIGHGLVVADGASAMAESIINFLRDDSLVDRLSREAKSFAIDWNAQQGRAFDDIFAHAF